MAGLGAVPQDTIINGQIDVFPNALDSEAQCLPGYSTCTGPGTNCYAGPGRTCYWANSTVNFWRSMSDLTLNVMTGTPIPYGEPGCTTAPGPCANPLLSCRRRYHMRRPSTTVTASEAPRRGRFLVGVASYAGAQS